jgi:hypothetical protein
MTLLILRLESHGHDFGGDDKAVSFDSIDEVTVVPWPRKSVAMAHSWTALWPRVAFEIGVLSMWHQLNELSCSERAEWHKYR